MSGRLERRLAAAYGGRPVLITGASRGIGAAAARMLGAAGAQLLLVARDADALAGTADGVRRAGGAAHPHPLDLRDTDAAARLARELLAQHGPPALVLANAGHSIHRAAAASVDRAHDAVRVMGGNHLGHVALLLGLLPAMRAARRGRVVASSSAALAVPAPGWAAYLSSKAALERWLRDVDAETRPDGVTLCAVRLPLVRTAMSAPTAAYRTARALAPDAAARRLLRASLGRRRLVQPWWGGAASVAAAAAPGAADALARRWEARLTEGRG